MGFNMTSPSILIGTTRENNDAKTRRKKGPEMPNKALQMTQTALGHFCIFLSPKGLCGMETLVKK